MLNINLEVDPTYQTEVVADTIIAIAQSVLTHCEVTEGELTVVITTDEAVQELNRTYRQVDAPTDVLSFATTESEESDALPDDFVMPDFIVPDDEVAYWGDIIIAFPTAARQAAASGHSVLDEVCLLVIHGILHLLGFDHHTPQAKAQMWQKQQAILEQNQLAHVKPTE